MNVQHKFPDPSQFPAPKTARAQGSIERALGYPRRHPFIIAALLALILGGGAYLYFGGTADTTGTPVVAVATRGDIEDLVTAVGNLQPITTVDVGAQVSGQLKKLYVQIGDQVQKDQLLADIDSTVMAAKVDADKAQLQNLQAQLLEKQSQLVLAGLQAARQTRLMADKATSQDADDIAQAAWKAAQAQVKSVQAQIAQAESSSKADQATLGYAKIYSPMAGTIAAIPAKEGQTLNANQQTPTILTVADLSTMTIWTQVSEADVGKLRLGMDAYFTTLSNSGRRWTGKLRQILPTPTVINNVVLYTALFDVANPTKELMAQMTAQVFFVRQSALDAVKAPVAALHFGASGTAGGRGGRSGGRAPADSAVSQPRSATVTVVKDDGSQEARQVTVGVSDRVNAQIISGLSEGEKVIAGVELNSAATRPAQGAPGGPGGFR